MGCTEAIMPGLKQALVVIGLLFFICSAPNGLRAGEFSFSIPVACHVGSECFIQNYYDHKVKPGQRVEQGDKLGLIGLSGNTEFPHVEFSVRYKGQDIDPFAGRDGFQGCGNTTGSLWTERALQDMPYQATGCLSSGFAGQVPKAEKARQGLCSTPKVSSPALVFWVDLFGVQKHDEQSFVLYDPEGKKLVENTTELSESNVVWFAYAGLRRPDGGWKKGRYKCCPGRQRLGHHGQQ